MRKNIILILTFISVVQGTAYASDIFRFDFQKYIGEGQLDLYRVEVNTLKLKGDMCFFDTGSVSISKEIADRLWKGVIWSNLLDLNKFEHACFSFDLYEPFGWFYSPPVKYGDAEYRFFFIGQIKARKMNGILYKFKDLRPEGQQSSYKIIDEIKVSASDSSVNK
jgi:hypothetical protein